ncbi:PAS domain-containing protein [Methylobacterium nonmethylotrophicum]|nr:PAS domain-containing protein [Methylobacterium nonmethylotrophicum]
MARDARSGWRGALARLFGGGRGAAERLLAGCPDLVAEIDRAGRLLSASPASLALTGRTPGALAGLSLAELIHPEDRAGLAALLAGGGALVHRLSPMPTGAGSGSRPACPRKARLSWR